MLNAAMIGLGWWGKELVRAQRDSKLMHFTRGVTLEPETVRDFAREMNLSVGTSYEDVLADKSIGAVVLATPHTRHRQQVEAAAAAGKHVFCEKPFALTVEDAKAALAACRKAGVALGVGHNRRLWPSMMKLKEVVSSREFGTVMFAEGNYSHDILADTPLDNWRSAPQETKAGGMTGMGIHRYRRSASCRSSPAIPHRRCCSLRTARPAPSRHRSRRPGSCGGSRSTVPRCGRSRSRRRK
jgi:predicted dehydrogenase